VTLILTFGLDLDSVKFIQHAKYISQRLMSSRHRHTHTHTHIHLTDCSTRTIKVVGRYLLAVFSERELTFTFAITHVDVRYMLSPVRLSVVCRLSVTFVHPTQAVEIFGNIFTALGTLAIR